MTNKISPKYKQMAFETAVRNPERYLDILVELVNFENVILNDRNLLKIMCHLYRVGVVTSKGILISDNLTDEDVSRAIIKVNSTRRADGGFPCGYPSRFWTYMRTLSELGMIYSQYNEPFKISEIANKLIRGEIDEQEAFSIQAMKYNRKSPYRNVLNDFNFFRFALEVLLKLKEKGRALTYEQFVILTFSQNGDVQQFIDVIDSHKFSDFDGVYDYLRHEYGVTNSINTVTKDYPDVVRRIMNIAGFITTRYSGIKFIEINENKLEYILDLLRVRFELEPGEKINAESYYNKLSHLDKQYLSLVVKYRRLDRIDGEKYTSKIIELIKVYEIDEKKILECIKSIDSNNIVIEDFREISRPLKLEFYIAILIALTYGEKFHLRPNYKADQYGKPYSHAPGNLGDIDVYSSEVFWLIEVTLIRNKTQLLNNETTSVIRHLNTEEEFKSYRNKYLSLVAPTIHSDTKDYFDVASILSSSESKKVNIKPYSIENFVETTIRQENLQDMEVYTQKVFEKFRSKLS